MDIEFGNTVKVYKTDTYIIEYADSSVMGIGSLEHHSLALARQKTYELFRKIKFNQQQKSSCAFLT